MNMMDLDVILNMGAARQGPFVPDSNLELLDSVLGWSPRDQPKSPHQLQEYELPAPKRQRTPPTKAEQIWRWFLPASSSDHHNIISTSMRRLRRLNQAQARTPLPTDVYHRSRECTRECADCGNTEYFIHDAQQADLCCGKCGLVIASHLVHDGSLPEYEDKKGRNHHNTSVSPWLSTAQNLAQARLTLKGAETAVQEVERTHGQRGDGQRGTTEAYKDRQKRDAFRLINQCAEKLQLPHGVIEQAKQSFFELRARAQRLQNLHEALAACLVVAWQERPKAAAPFGMGWEARLERRLLAARRREAVEAMEVAMLTA